MHAHVAGFRLYLHGTCAYAGFRLYPALDMVSDQHRRRHKFGQLSDRIGWIPAAYFILYKSKRNNMTMFITYVICMMGVIALLYYRDSKK